MTRISPAGRTKEGGFILPDVMIGIFLLSVAVGIGVLAFSQNSQLVDKSYTQWLQGVEVRNQ